METRCTQPKSLGCELIRLQRRAPAMLSLRWDTGRQLWIPGSLGDTRTSSLHRTLLRSMPRRARILHCHTLQACTSTTVHVPQTGSRHWQDAILTASAQVHGLSSVRGASHLYGCPLAGCMDSDNESDCNYLPLFAPLLATSKAPGISSAAQRCFHQTVQCHQYWRRKCSS